MYSKTWKMFVYIMGAKREKKEKVVIQGNWYNLYKKYKKYATSVVQMHNKIFEFTSTVISCCYTSSRSISTNRFFSLIFPYGNRQLQ